jgi:hypothetical protein
MRHPFHQIFCFVLASMLLFSCRPIKALGKNPEGETLKRIEALPNYKNGAFQNHYQLPQAEPVATANRRPGWLRLLKFLKGQPKSVLPSKSIAAVDTELVNSGLKSLQ